MPLIREIFVTKIARSLTRRGLILGARAALAAKGLSWAIHRIMFALRNCDKEPSITITVATQHDEVMAVTKGWAGTVRAKARWSLPYGARPVPRTVPAQALHSTRFATLNIHWFGTKKTELGWYLKRAGIDIVALQETRVDDLCWGVSLPGFNAYNSAPDADIPGAHGVSLLVRRQLKSFLIESTPHMVHVRVLGLEDKRPWEFISVYVPGREVPRAQRRSVINAIRAKARKLLDNNSGDARVVLMGDWNIRGDRVTSRVLTKALGYRRLAVQGDERTYHRAGVPVSDIDHVLTSPAAAERLRPGKVDRGCSLSDHYPLVVRLRSKRAIGYRNETSPFKLDPSKVKDSAGVPTQPEWSKWAEELEENPITTIEDLELAAEKWLGTSRLIGERLGLEREPPSTRNRNLPRSVVSLLESKRRASKLRATEGTEEAKKSYLAIRKAAKEALSTHGKIQWAKFVAKGAKAHKEGDTRRFFRWAETLGKYKGKVKTGLLPVKDDLDQLHFDEAKINELWNEHYKGLGSLPPELDKVDWEEAADATKVRRFRAMNNLSADLEWSELQCALRSTRGFKAPGMDGLPAEWYKVLIDKVGQDEPPEGPTSGMQRVLWALMNGIWDLAKVPDCLNTSLIVSIFKKGDATDRGNYRGISLIPVIVKLITRVVMNRVTKGLEHKGRIAPEQAGFRTREECMGQVITLLEVIRCRAEGRKARPTIILFIDCVKAYDRVPHEALRALLSRSGIHGKPLDFIMRGLYESTWCSVSVDGKPGPKFQLRRGLRQGCTGSPMLFDVFINPLAKLLRNSGLGCADVTSQTIACLLFADDLAITLDDASEVEPALRILEEWASRWGMGVSGPKSGLVVYCDPDGTVRDAVQLLERRCQGQVIEILDAYLYLGCLIANEDKPWLMKAHSNNRIALFRKRTKRLMPLLSCKTIPLNVRLHLLKVVCLPVLRWGAEALPMNAGANQPLTTCYMKVVKEVIGTRGSQNTIFAYGPLVRELGLRSWRDLQISSRWRAYRKFPTLRTLVAQRAEHAGARSWFGDTARWLKRYPKVDLKTSEKDQWQALTDYWESQSRSAAGVAAHLKSGYRCTSSYIVAADRHPEIAAGVNWLARARVQGIWTSKRAASARLIDMARKSLCAVCEEPLQSDPEIGHLLLQCTMTSTIRLEYLSSFAGCSWTQTLGGFSEREKRKAKAWCGLDSATWKDTGKPGYYWVAKALMSIGPQLMRALWDK